MQAESLNILPTPPLVQESPISDYSWIELSKSAFESNIATYRSMLQPHIGIGVVVKANAYGHGMSEISLLCEQNSDISWLFVSHLSEAIQLRNAGITKAILVMSATISDFQYAAQLNIDLMMSDLECIKQAHTVGVALGSPINIHLKIDTGLSRFGFFAHEAIEVIAQVQQLPGVRLQGMYSHFSESNNSSLEYTHHQEEIFNSLLEQIKQLNIAIPFRHLANSAAISATTHKHVNLVRLGAGAYGIWPSEANRQLTTQTYHDRKLTPMLSWKTKIVHIKQIPANTYIGYNRTYITHRPTTIAILPIGYYDGYDKRLSNRATTRIGNQYAPVIGLVGMNNTTIDISAIPGCKIGDEVTLLGNHPHIASYDFAYLTGSLNTREMVTRLHHAIPRKITL